MGQVTSTRVARLRATEDALSRNGLVTVAVAVAVGYGLTLTIWEASALPLLSRDFLLALGGLVLVAGLPAALALRLVAALGDRLLPGRRGWQLAALLGLVGSFAIAGPAVVATRAALPMLLGDRITTSVFLLGLLVLARPERPAGRRAIAALLTVAMAAGTTVGLASDLRVRDWTAPTAPHQAAPVSDRTEVVLIGIDGLGWDMLSRWAAAGGSEDYEWLLAQRTVIAPLETMRPTQSPRIWTTMSTGRHPIEHGALAFTSHDVRGFTHSIPEIPSGHGAFFWKRLVDLTGVVTSRPIAGLDTRCPTFWELAGHGAWLVDVVGWWCTWPAEPVRGRLVSDRYYFHAPESDSPTIGLTHPAALASELDAHRVLPTDLDVELVASFVDMDLRAVGDLVAHAGRVSEAPADEDLVEHELPRALAMDETHYEIAEMFLERKPDRSLRVFYFRGVDLVGHAGLPHSSLYATPEAPGATDGGISPSDPRFRHVVSRYLAYTFSRVRRLIELAGEDAIVLIVSDHGFQRLSDGTFAHPDAPPGVLIARLPDAYDPTVPESPTVYDVAPTMLWLCGLPVAEDMSGRVWTSLLRPAPDVVTHVATYGTRRSSLAHLVERLDGAEEMQLLRNLGYIQ